MAATLTEEQKNQLAKILGVPIIAVNDQITFIGELLTTQVATDLAAEITRWVTNGKGSKFVGIAPTTTNKGVDHDPEREKADIRRNVAVLLQNPDWIDSGSAQAKLYRG